MADVPQTTADDALRGRPKLISCAWCGGSREDQARASYYTADGQPLCKRCWETEYNDGEPDVGP